MVRFAIRLHTARSQLENSDFIRRVLVCLLPEAIWTVRTVPGATCSTLTQKAMPSWRRLASGSPGSWEMNELTTSFSSRIHNSYYTVNMFLPYQALLLVLLLWLRTTIDLDYPYRYPRRCCRGNIRRRVSGLHAQWSISYLSVVFGHRKAYAVRDQVSLFY